MQHYKQTTYHTSGPSSLLMVLNHFNPKVKLDRKNEFKIWLESAVLPTRASSIYALATIAHKNNIKTKVVVGNLKYKFPNYRFRGYKLEEVKEASLVSRLYYNRAIKSGVDIEEHDFTLEDVKKLLKEGKFVILRLDAGFIGGVHEHEVKYILLASYKNKRFEIMDPGSSRIIVPESEVREAFDSVITKRKRDHRMIVFG